VLERVERSGAYADLMLHAALGRSGLSAPDRAFATELVYGTLRWRGRLDHLLSHLVDRDLDRLDAFVANALRLGAYQLVFADGIPDTAAVDESVRCVRAAGLERATGLVNAVLRRLAREREQIPLPSLEADPVGHLTHTLSLPAWLAERWLELYGAEEAAALARACNRPPPLTVRVNPHHCGRDELLRELRNRFPEAEACRHAPRGIVLGRRGNPALEPAFGDGRFTVQDEGSQLVVALLDPQPGERVLDLCAAPGGKATAIAEDVGREGRVLALDRHGGRLELVRRAARRLGLSRLEARVRDASRPLTGLVGQAGPFDRVLLDAPCSGIGTLRRNPDARWRLQKGDPEQLAEVQRTMLRNAATVVKPGGVLVYATCTQLPEENEGVVGAFLSDTPGFERTPRSALPAAIEPLVGDDDFLRCQPHRHDTDGFVAVRLEHRP
jgi:16S rRNA (cytosine967-C5)-methyltransferase